MRTLTLLLVATALVVGCTTVPAEMTPASTATAESTPPPTGQPSKAAPTATPSAFATPTRSAPPASPSSSDPVPTQLACSDPRRAATTPPAPSIAGVINLGCEAGGVAVGGDSVWVVPHLDPVLLRVDPASDAVVDRVALGGLGPGAEIDGAQDMVWVSVSEPFPSFDRDRLAHIDAETGEVLASIELEAGFPVIGAGFVWAEGDGGEVYRIDPTTYEVVELDVRDCAPLTTDSSVWCIGSGGAAVLDPQTGESQELAVDEELEGPFAWVGGMIWGVSRDGLWALDPESGHAIDDIPPPGGVAMWSPDATILDGALWVAASSVPGDPFETPADRLVRIDPDAREPDCVLEVPQLEYGIASGFGAMWAPVARAPSLLRIVPRCEP